MVSALEHAVCEGGCTDQDEEAAVFRLSEHFVPVAYIRTCTINASKFYPYIMVRIA